MSPDIEWHIGEESDRETIVKTTPRRPPPWRKPIVIIAAVLGIGLGIAYAAIPEPPQPPAPTPTVPSPTSTPQPPSLDEAIRRDAYALTANTGEVYPTTFFTTAPSSAMEEYADWYRALQSTDVHWDPIGPRSMYTVFETGTLPDGTAWAKMGQFRNGDFFRQIRFYRLQDNRWTWTLPDRSFWSGTVETHTFSFPGSYPFTMIYPVEDQPLVSTAAERFARAFIDLCSSLRCPSDQETLQPWLHTITLTIVVDPDALNFHGAQARGDYSTITLPALRVVGYYENPYRPGDPLTSLAYDTLIDPVAQIATGDYQRWSTQHGGALFLESIANWQRLRSQELVNPSDIFFKQPRALLAASGVTQPAQEFYASLLKDMPLVPLISLWDWPLDDSSFNLLFDAAKTETDAVIVFIRERYGAEGVVKFLNALGRADSLPAAIEQGLGTKYTDFAKQWMTWIGKA